MGDLFQFDSTTERDIMHGCLPDEFAQSAFQIILS
jgi:hypothetical protein